MVKCCEEEIPCCDFCKYCIHSPDWSEMYAKGEPMLCSLHKDKKHTELVLDCSYCDDFYCRIADLKK